MDNINVLTEGLKRYCSERGAGLVGVAGLEPFRERLPVVPSTLLDSYAYGISIGMLLKDDVIDKIIDRPTPEYAEHYREINAALDGLAPQVERWIRKRGFDAKAIPASHIVDHEDLLGNISHKAVARMAGLGWQGKSLLIINPDIGPRFRLTTVLTNMPLIADRPIKNRCGRCVKCFRACPASAIKNVSTGSHYESRDEAIHLKGCFEKVTEFKGMPGIGVTICGVCIKVCPYGRTDGVRPLTNTDSKE